ncbi:MAG: hypothetical protein K2X38_21320 [Gemmataceae bacterium]|nr:hypothetical protein [Gemmataceae bacterium]
MKSELLQKWLGIPKESWPPDHYTLLGLSRGEADASHIERQVQDRMAALRCYQLSHPEEATEGMNRVAQAFVCLTQSGSRTAYDATLPAVPSTPAPPPALKRSIDDTVVGVPAPGPDWRAAPPPVRRSEVVARIPAPLTHVPASDDTVAENPVLTTTVDSELSIPVSVAKPAAPSRSSQIDVESELRHLAQRSTDAKSGLGTLEAIIDRVDRTRALLIAWERLGHFVRSPKRALKPKEEEELTRRWHALQAAIAEYPAFLAQPGKPGYRVTALGRLDAVAVLFRSMDEDQRRLLAADWLHAHHTLRLHRSFLRQQFKDARRRSKVGLGVRALRFLLNDHPFATSAVAFAILAFVVWARLQMN